MRFAYADPPYPGMAYRYPENEEVDHAALIARLSEYDGWALSTGSVQLQEVIALCPKGVRVAAWVKSYVCMRPNVNPFYAWEPVIFTKRNLGKTREPIRDWIEHQPHPGWVLGRKPPAFCYWVLNLLGYQPGDTLDDIYPGSGIMGRVVASREAQLVLTPEPVEET